MSGTLTIGQASPTVSIADDGGPWTGLAYPATATVNGASSLEGVGLTLIYYTGSTINGTGSTTAPSTAGTYTVEATFPGSTDYTAASSGP